MLAATGCDVVDPGERPHGGHLPIYGIGGRLFPFVDDGSGNTVAMSCEGAEDTEVPLPPDGVDDAAYDEAEAIWNAHDARADAAWARGIDESVLGERLAFGYVHATSLGGLSVSSVYRLRDEVAGPLMRRPTFRVQHRRPVVLAAAVFGRDMKETRTLKICAKVGSAWLDAITGRPAPDAANEIEQAAVDQLARRYRWTVEVSLSPRRPGVALETDALGAREFLAMRDRGPAQRRAALLHWVREHMRRSRQVDAGASLVAAHMRGRTEAKMFGLHCRVWPSAYDCARARNGERFAAAERIDGNFATSG